MIIVDYTTSGGDRLSVEASEVDPGQSLSLLERNYRCKSLRERPKRSAKIIHPKVSPPRLKRSALRNAESVYGSSLPCPRGVQNSRLDHAKA